MPVFEYNGKKYNVKDEHIDSFMSDYPNASTIMEREGKKYRVRSADYKTFLAESSQPEVEQMSPIQVANSPLMSAQQPYYTPSGDYSQPTDAQKNYEERGAFEPIGQGSVKLNDRDVPVLYGKEGEFRVPSPVALDEQEEIFRHGNPSEEEQREEQEQSYRNFVQSNRARMDENDKKISERMGEMTRKYFNDYKGVLQSDAMGEPAYMTALKGNRDYQNLRAAHNLIEDARKREKQVRRADEGFLTNTFRSMGETAIDERTWDFGARDMTDAISLYQAVQKDEKGEELTESERILLDAFEGNALVMAQNKHRGESGGELAGAMTVEMIPFIAQIVANPIAKLGEATSKGAAKVISNWLYKRTKDMANKTARKAVRSATRGAVKFGAGAPADLVGGMGVAVTSNVMNTTADVYDRMLKGDSAGEAIAKGITSQGIEFASENAGRFFEPFFGGLGKVLGRGAEYGLNKVGAGSVVNLAKDYAKKAYTPAVKEFMDKTQWSGFLGEYGEELVGGVENALLVGDQTVSEVFSKDNLFDTAVGLSVASVLFPAIGTVNYGVEKGRQRKAVKEAEKIASDILKDRWPQFKAAINGAKNSDELGKAIEEIYKKEGKEYSDNKETQALFDYARSYYAYNALKGVDPNNVAYESELISTVRDNYQAGATMTAEELDNTRMDVNRIGVELMRLTGMTEDELNDMDTAAVTQRINEAEENGDIDIADKWREFMNGSAAMSGKVKAVDNAINEQSAASDAEVDAITNGDGMIVLGTTRGGEQVYIIGGNVVLNGDNSVNKEGSSAQLTVVRDGKRTTMGIVELESVDAPIDAAGEKVSRRTAIEENLRRQLRIDMGEEHVFTPGEKFETLQGEVQFVADRGDGTADITVNGNATVVDMGTLNELFNTAKQMEYNARKAEEASQAQTVQAEAPQPVNDEQVTSETTSEVAQSALQRVPKDEQGEPIYEQVDSDTAWDAIIEQTEGDEAMAQTVADGMVADKEAALKKLEKAKAKGGATIAEKIAAEKERMAAIEAAKAELAKWKEIAGVGASRKAAPDINDASKTKTVAEEVKPNESVEVPVVEDVHPTNEMQPVEVDQVEDNLEMVTVPSEADNGNENGNENLRPITAPAEVTDVETADEFVAGLLGGIKITPESFRKETGLGINEQRKLVGIIAGEEKGGVSVERASEIIAENYAEELAASGFNGDEQDIRNMLIDILSSGNPRSYVKQSKERRAAEWVEQETARADAWASENFGFASYDDLIAYEETLIPNMIQKYAGFDEQTYFNTLAENYEYDTTRESERVGSGSEVLQGERSVPADGIESIGERNQGGAVQYDVQGGAENADVQEQEEVGPVEGGKWEETKAPAKPWNEMSAQERMLFAEKNPITIEEVINSSSDDINKSNAVAYIRGTSNIITQLSYLKVYEDVRIRPTDVAQNNGSADGTQLAQTDGGESTDGRAGGETGDVSLSVSEESSRETASIANGGENSERESDLLSGEEGNREVLDGESSLVGVSPTSGNSRRGGKRRSNGGDGRRRGRSDGGENTGDDAAESNAASVGSIDDKISKALDGFKSTLSDFVKAGRETLNLNLAGLNSKQLEILPKLISEGTKVGYLLVKKGVRQLGQWIQSMKSYIGAPLSDAGLSDTEVDAFIQELWNSQFPIGDEEHTISEWASIIGMEETRKAVKTTITDKKTAQDAAEGIGVKVANAENIAETLPFLLPQQQEDVLRAETQFFDESHNDREHAFGKGYMFTNGTGTGKTYTGLGIVKRFIKQGKGRILIVTPSQQKVTDWIADAKNLNISLRSLDDFASQNGTTATQTAGEGAVITTYANFRENAALLEGVFDLVVYDESHRLLENKAGTETRGAQQHYMITNRDEDAAYMRLREINPIYKKISEAQEKFISIYEKEIENKSQKNIPRLHTPLSEDYKTNFPKLYKAKEAYNKAEQAWGKEELKLREQAKKDATVTKVVFLSATPFNTRDNLDYAERYIFMYPEENKETIGSYKHQSPRTRFYLDHFGGAYKFRYGRLESAAQNADVISRQEVAFSDYLQNTLNTMSGRVIDSEFDYSRDFPTVSLEMGERINSAIGSISEVEALRPLWSARNKVWGNYNYSSALFETMKVSAMVPRLKEHLGKGRKIVIFHRRTESKEPIMPPFSLMMGVAQRELKETQNEEERKKLASAIRKFKKDYADLFEWEQTLNYAMPREQLAEAFGKENVLFFSGKESAKVKNEAVKQFNDDNSGKNIIVIQEASGKEGISLHDRTGKHQRVVITLALPQSPITALQIEGRIYRIGNKSNAIFEYPILGLNSEMVLFGQNFNSSVSTTENLALGSKARNLRDSFAKGIEERSGDISVDIQGVGGKEADAGTLRESDPYDNAVLDYYTNQKITAKRDNREGVDYYPTPEPLGFMMNMWGRVKEGDEILEPSAGHGAIARYAPAENRMTAVEPSQSLFARLQIKAGGVAGRSFVNDIFENYNIVNKHDVVLMNPPFGVQGKLAAEHVAKAYKHLNEGGRIVAIVPEGKAQDRIGKWLDEQKDAVVVGEVLLPDVTFVQAGTSIRCRVLVIDKISNEAKRNNAAAQKVTHNLSYVDKVEDFFEALRDIGMPDRTIDTQLIMEKKARRYASDLRSIKGVKEVYVNSDSIVVRTKGWRSFQIVWGDLSGDALKRSLAQQYSNFANKIPYADETSQEVMMESQAIICKLANMTEDEMERFIAGPVKEDDTLYRSDDAIKNRIEALFNQAISGEFKGKPISIGRLTDAGKAYLEQISGVTFKDYVDFVLNPSDLVHIYKDHFGNNEKDKGQNIPLDIEDIRSLVDVISSPDKVIFFKEGEGSNRNMFYFFKEAEDGTYNLMEIYSDRKGNLTAKTFYKTRKDATQRVMDIEKSLLPTSETYSGAILSDTKIPQMFESASIEDDFSTRPGEGVYSDDEVSFENDPISKVLESTEGLTGRRAKAKGWYEKSTGKIVVVLPNNRSVTDVMQTVLHEAVAHYGLRKLFGVHFDDFIDNIYNNVDAETRQKINLLASRNGWNLKVATEEYLASLAEDSNFERVNPSLWQRIKSFFLDMLAEAGVRLDIELSDNELRYILWRSYQNLKNPGRYRTIADEARDIAKQGELKVGNYADNGTADVNVAEESDEGMVIGKENSISLPNNFNSKENVNDRKTLPAARGARAFIERNAWVVQRDGRAERPTQEVEKIIRDFNRDKTVYARTPLQLQTLALLRVLTNNEIDDIHDALEVLSTKVKDAEQRKEYGEALEVVKRFKNRNERGTIIRDLTGADLGEEIPLAKIDELFEMYNSDVKTAELYKRVRPFAEELGITLVFDELEQDEQGGIYTPSDNSIVYNAHMLYAPYVSQQRKASTIVHEMIHAVTVFAISAKKNNIKLSPKLEKAAQTINDIYDNVVKGNPLLVHEEYNAKTDKMEPVADYGASSAYEMISELSNPEFVEKLKQIEYDGRSVWQRIWDAIKSIFVGKNETPSVYEQLSDAFDTIVENFDREAYERTREDGYKFFNMISDIAEQEDDILFRSDEQLSAQQLYDKDVSGLAYNIKEGWVDRYSSLKAMMEAIEKETGKDVADYANIYYAMEHLSARNRAKMDVVMKQYVEPLMALVNDFAKIGIQQKDVERYLNSKHGLERNREMAVADACKKVDENGKAVFDKDKFHTWEQGRDAIYKEGKSWADTEAALDKLAKTFGVSLNKDYSGLTAIYKDREKGLSRRKAAYDAVVEFERKAGTELIKNLWEGVNAINNFSLDESFESGLMAKETRDKLKRRYKYYVPLRGFNDKAVTEYEYLSSTDFPLQGINKAAHGRYSEATDIIPTMMNMMESAVVLGNKNRAKLALLHLAEQYPTKLLTVSNSWYSYNAVNDTWVPVAHPQLTPNMTPEQVADTVNQWEADMRDLEKQGKAKRFSSSLQIDKVGLERWKQDEHSVKVKRNGKEYVIWVNGNPKAAQAINGILGKQSQDTSKFFQWSEKANRWRAKNITSRNPEFVLGNFARDIQQASKVSFIKYGFKYLKSFEANLWRHSIPKIHRLYYLYGKGKLNMNDPVHRMFNEFMQAGSETGFVTMMSIEDYQKKIDKLVSPTLLDKVGKPINVAIDAFGTATELTNRGVENACRFAAFMTSRKMGHSLLESVNDAKEVSLNFDRKGSGAYGNMEARQMKMFLNPTIQGLAQQITLIKKYPARAIPVTMAEMAMGYFAGKVAIYLFNWVASLFTGDDDEKYNYSYYNIPEFVRRNNLIIPTGRGVNDYVVIPLSHEQRVAYGVGEILGAFKSGHMDSKDVAVSLIAQAAQALPMNPFDAEAFIDPNRSVWENFLKTVSPDILVPGLEALFFNENFAGMRVTNQSDFNKHLPEYKRALKNTPKYMVELSKIINEATGGTSGKKGWADSPYTNNPAVWDHLAKAYLGGIYSFPSKISKTILGYGFDDDDFREPKNWPIIGKFYMDTSNYEQNPEERTRRDYENAFYKFKDECGAAAKELTTYKKEITSSDEEVAKEAQENLKAFEESKRNSRFVEYFKQVEKEEKNLKEALDKAREFKDKELEDELEQRLILLKKEAVKYVETQDELYGM